MSRQNADALVERLEQADAWPPPSEQPVRQQVAVWAAMRESDRGPLKTAMRWEDTERRRDLFVDPLPEKIAEAYADLIFGEDPKFTAAAPGDQDQLTDLVEENALPSELRRAEQVCSSEGEVWWRIYVDPQQGSFPQIEWHSRLAVVPLFRGRALLAAAFVSDLGGRDEARWRYVEVQADTVTYNLLYRGTRNDLGKRESLSGHPETRDLPDEWPHGLDMLCGRVVNKPGRHPSVGRSDYEGVRDLLFALNEAVTIGHENARLTAKKRLVVPTSLIDEDGDFKATGADVIRADSQSQTYGEGAGPVSQIEYSFDADALIAYQRNLVDTILNRCGIVAQFTGSDGRDGFAQSGTALKVRLIPTTLSAEGKARFWDDALPELLRRCQLVSALPEKQGGRGRQWAKAGDPPAVERTPVLPEDESEQIDRHARAVGAELESRFTAIREMRPEWDDQQVTEELARIRSEATAGLPELSEPDAARAVVAEPVE